MSVYTTLNMDYQKKATQAIQNGLRDLDKKMGWKGVKERIELDDLNTRQIFLSQKLP